MVAIDGFASWRARLTKLASWVALAGGAALALLALFTVASVIGGAFGRPILGDQEVTELVIGAVVASFLPYCQLNNGHIAITLFTDKLPPAVRLGLDRLAISLTAIVALLLTWRLAVGGFDAYDRGRISMFLELPTWWGFLSAFIPCALWTVAAGFMVAERTAGITPQIADQP